MQKSRIDIFIRLFSLGTGRGFSKTWQNLSFMRKIVEVRFLFGCESLCMVSEPSWSYVYALRLPTSGRNDISYNLRSRGRKQSLMEVGKSLLFLASDVVSSVGLQERRF
jgi:hypothetical protein